MSKLLLDQEFYEHANHVDITACEQHINKTILFKNREDRICASIVSTQEKKSLTTNYYIGTDWLIKNELAVLISPKLSKNEGKIDYLQMMFSCLKHPEIISYTGDLYEIKFDEPYIEIEQKYDQLTPLLVVHFAQILKTIVTKGLKRSYYKVEHNLTGKVKGKILVNKTVKLNISKNKPYKALCAYDEFGLNSVENQLLKRALFFCQRYLSAFPDYQKYALPVLAFCSSAFEMVSDQIETHEFKSTKPNAFYKEYYEGLRIAKIILKRFGYNIKSTEQKTKISVPPFWVDMSRLFELYVLGLLKDKYGEKVKFHFTAQYNELDYLLNTNNEKIIIDAKYKTIYKNGYRIEDIRQLSGYSRVRNVVKDLGYKTNEEQTSKVIDCLIIFPNKNADLTLGSPIRNEPIPQFINFFKHGVRLPVIG